MFELKLNLWFELLAITQQIYDLNFENDEVFEQLSMLQEQQTLLRKKIDKLNQNDRMNSEQIEQIIQKCIELEKKINLKMQEHQLIISGQIQEIQKGKKLKKYYQNEYTQKDGFFVDKHN